MDTNSPEYKMLEREIGSIDETISAITTLARLDEDTFKTIFLPMFLGVEKEKLHPHAQMGAWIKCAGGVYNEVEVYGADGEKLFNVPPVRLQLPVDYQRDRRATSLASEIQTAMLHTARHPKQGEVYLKQVLDTYVVNTKELELVLDYMKRWSDIFTRYGHPAIPIPNMNSETANSATETRAASDEVEELL